MGFYCFSEDGRISPLHSFTSVAFPSLGYQCCSNLFFFFFPLLFFLFLSVYFFSPATLHCVIMCVKSNIYFCSATCPESSKASCVAAVGTNSPQLQSAFPASPTFLFHMLTPF